jgi:type II secretory pathway component GspD/PulD (secretin)
VLGDIPLLGLLFKSTTKQVRKRSVLYLIRPRIVTAEDLLFEPEPTPP